MLRAFCTWDPYRDRKCFFDKSVWQRMFRTMNSCGMNAMILADERPFSFMIDFPPGCPNPCELSESDSARFQEMHHWIFENALDYDIAPYLLFFPMRYPAYEEKEGSVSDASGQLLLGLQKCLRILLETYPELMGIVASVEDCDTELIQKAVIEPMDAARPDAFLYLRCSSCEPNAPVGNISRRGGRGIGYCVKYTEDHLVDANPDPSFTRCVEAVGAENVLAEFPNANFEPWTSFSFDTVEEILGNLEELNCAGFSVVPLASEEWPRVSDKYFKYQFQRDFIWYNAWGGNTVSELIRAGQPKWLLRNKRVMEGFRAGSRILELLSLYIAADKTKNWQPQFCSIGETPHLLSIEDMLHFDDEAEFPAGDWWREITGDEVIHPADYVRSGTQEHAYGPDELIEELSDLSEQAVAAGERGMRSNSGEKELPGLTRDAFCMGRLGEFYVERFKASLAHARSEGKEALEHMNRALGHYREIRGIDSSHRRGDIASNRWTAVITALEAEYEDASLGKFKRGVEYPIKQATGFV